MYSVTATVYFEWDSGETETKRFTVKTGTVNEGLVCLDKIIDAYEIYNTATASKVEVCSKKLDGR